jgi:hypothetical protein
MGVSEIREMRSAMLRGLAAELDVPVELLPEPAPLEGRELPLSPAERQALEGAAKVQEGLDRIADEIGPDLIRSFGLDPERYHLRWTSVPFEMEPRS